MKPSASTCIRVLAVSPSQRGLGFAVLEGPQELIDWGIKEVRQEKNTRCLKQVMLLIESYCTDVVVIEDYQDKDCRRGTRIKELLESIAALALSRRIKLRRISRSALRKAFSQHSVSNKHQIATEIGKQFPELAPLVPPIRKPWMSQDVRLTFFEAVAFALALFTVQNPH